MRTALLAAVSLCTLAACRSEPEVDARNASVEEVANQVAQADDGTNFISPGQWQSVVTIEEVSAPGMPPEMAERMKTMMGGGQTAETCLTQEQVKRPSEEFFAGKGNQCRYDHFTMGDGKIDAKMRCTQGQVVQVMEMDGSYAPDRYQMNMQTNMEGGGPPGGMTMRMRVDAKRTGECKATQG